MIDIITIETCNSLFYYTSCASRVNRNFIVRYTCLNATLNVELYISRLQYQCSCICAVKPNKYLQYRYLFFFF